MRAVFSNSVKNRVLESCSNVFFPQGDSEVYFMLSTNFDSHLNIENCYQSECADAHNLVFHSTNMK